MGGIDILTPLKWIIIYIIGLFAAYILISVCTSSVLNTIRNFKQKSVKINNQGGSNNGKKEQKEK